MLPPLTCANTFIKKAKETGTPLSPMKLQKLMYLFYARYFQKTNSPLFADNFECWQYGPVVSEVYHAFKQYGAEPIGDYCYDCDGNVYVMDPDQNMEDCFQETWGKFQGYSGVELSGITHKAGTAWDKAKKRDTLLLNWEEIKEDGKTLFAGGLE